MQTPVGVRTHHGHGVHLPVHERLAATYESPPHVHVMCAAGGLLTRPHSFTVAAAPTSCGSQLATWWACAALGRPPHRQHPPIAWWERELALLESSCSAFQPSGHCHGSGVGHRGEDVCWHVAGATGLKWRTGQGRAGQGSVLACLILQYALTGQVKRNKKAVR